MDTVPVWSTASGNVGQTLTMLTDTTSATGIDIPPTWNGNRRGLASIGDDE